MNVLMAVELTAVWQARGGRHAAVADRACGGVSAPGTLLPDCRARPGAFSCAVGQRSRGGAASGLGLVCLVGTRGNSICICTPPSSSADTNTSLWPPGFPFGGIGVAN